VRDAQRLKDILAAIEAIEAYAVSNYQDFSADHKTQDAVMYNLVVMGEAANQISAKFREQHESIPWPSIIGTRNVIIHGYDQVKLQIVWEIISRDLKSLKKEVEKALQSI